MAFGWNITSCVVLLFTGPSLLIGQAQWHLVEDRRIIGGESGATSFGEVRDIAVDQRGSIYILDSRDWLVRQFDSVGRFVRAIGRRGAGPGEYERPNGIRVAPDGRVWVNDIRQQRFVVYRPDGVFDRIVTTTPTTGMIRWTGEFDARGRLVDIGIAFGRQDNSISRLMVRYDPPSGRWDSLPLPRCDPEAMRIGTGDRFWRYQEPDGETVIVSKPFLDQSIIRVMASATVWCGAGQDFVIHGIDIASQQTIARIQRSVPRVAIPAHSRDSALAAIRKTHAAAPPGVITDSGAPREYQRFQRFEMDDQNRLWVFQPSVSGNLAEVYRPDGQLVASVVTPRTFTESTPLVMVGGMLYTVIATAAGVPSVVRYLVKQ